MRKSGALFMCLFLLSATLCGGKTGNAGEKELLLLKVDTTLTAWGKATWTPADVIAQESVEISIAESFTIPYELVKDREIQYNTLDRNGKEDRKKTVVSVSGEGKAAGGDQQITWSVRGPSESDGGISGVYGIYFNNVTNSFAGTLSLGSTIEDFAERTNVRIKGNFFMDSEPWSVAEGTIRKAYMEYAKQKYPDTLGIYPPLHFNGGRTASGTESHHYRHTREDYSEEAFFSFNYKAELEVQPKDGDDDFKAVPAVASVIQRGQTLQLDGTASRGDIEEYIWTLTPKSADVQTTTKLGSRQELIVLDDLDVTLTVTGGGRFSSESVSVKVEPRPEFKTKPKHRTEEGLLDGAAIANVRAPEVGRMFGKYELLWLAGENVCAIDPAQSRFDTTHILHPNVYHYDHYRSADVEKDTLFDLKQVQDPGGPWHGHYYFIKWKMQVDRMNLINPHLLPTAPPIDESGRNFYQINKLEGTDVDGYLASVRRHETTHSLLAFEALASHDPAREIEKRWGADRKKLEDDAFKFIVETEREIWNHAKDPLPDTIWQGNLALRLRTTGELVLAPCEMMGVARFQQ